MYGPPHDNYTGVNAAQIESCAPVESTLEILATCRVSQRLCQCHVETGSVNHTLAVFLIGAYAGTTAAGQSFGSYFGYGPWTRWYFTYIVLKNMYYNRITCSV